MDINNAFLQADLHKEVYVTQPEGFIDANQPNHIFCLKQALYSLKQAPLAWNWTLNVFLTSIGFAVAVDLCLYLLHSNPGANVGSDSYDPELHQLFMYSPVEGKPAVLILVYMDYLLIVGSDDNVTETK
jgi:hypothetical protein